jgi:hypothetical protein
MRQEWGARFGAVPGRSLASSVLGAVLGRDP